MLDLYALADTDITSEIDAPPEGGYLGSLELAEVTALACVRQRCHDSGIAALEFSDDCRWTSAEMKLVLEISRECRGRGGGPQALDRLSAMLEQAAERGCGIAAYAD